MKNILKHFKPFWIQIIPLLIFTALRVYADLSLPELMGRIIDEGIVSNDLETIYNIGLGMLIITLISGIFSVITGLLSARIGSGFSRDLRTAVFSKIENFSLVEFNKFSTASLIIRTTNDIQQVQMVLIMLLRIALMAPLMAIVAISKAFFIAPEMNWIIISALGALIFVIVFIFSIASPRFRTLQNLIDRLNLITREMLTGLRVVRAFGKEKFEEEKFASTNREYTRLNLFLDRLMETFQPIMSFIMNLTTLAVIWFGAQLIDLGELEVGKMITFTQYVMQAIMSFMLISMIFIILPRALVSLGRISEVLASETVINDPKKPKKSKGLNGVVEFKNVTFYYEGAEKPALENISFSALPGEVTAIVGSTGSGKTTILNLITRFYEVTEGEVTVSGVNVKDLKQKDLRAKLGYVPQKAVLFSGTVKENIAFGQKNVKEEIIKEAIKIAQASDFVEKLENKYLGEVSQAGANFSGGQKQRLSIARALAKKPEIFLFDDSFSALDFKTDAKLRLALKPEIKDKTTIIVAQRISTIMKAEKIIVLEDGKMAGMGTHKELMKNCTVYREIALSQLSEKELKK